MCMYNCVYKYLFVGRCVCGFVGVLTHYCVFVDSCAHEYGCVYVYAYVCYLRSCVHVCIHGNTSVAWHKRTHASFIACTCRKIYQQVISRFVSSSRQTRRGRFRGWRLGCSRAQASFETWNYYLTRTHTLTHALTHTLTRTHSLTHSHTLTHALTHSLTDTQTYALTLTHTVTRRLTYPHIHTRIYTHLLIRTHTVTHIHTRVLTHTHRHTHSLTFTSNITHTATHLDILNTSWDRS